VPSGSGLSLAEGRVGLLLLRLFQSKSGEVRSVPEHLASRWNQLCAYHRLNQQQIGSERGSLYGCSQHRASLFFLVHHYQQKKQIFSTWNCREQSWNCKKRSRPCARLQANALAPKVCLHPPGFTTHREEFLKGTLQSCPWARTDGIRHI